MTVVPTAARQAVIAAGQTQIGVPYSYGGGGYYGPSLGIEQGAQTVGFDCAHFSQFAYYQGTHELLPDFKPTRYLAAGTVAQSGQGLHVGWTYDDITSLALPGDLIFFNAYGHCGIYVGQGDDQWGRTNLPIILHAPHTGTAVRLEPVYPGEGGLVVSEIRQYLPRS